MELILQNERLADHLYQIYEYYILKNDEHRAKVFLEASEKIRIYPGLIISGKDAKNKTGRGIGPSTIEVIDQFISTGTSDRLDDLKRNDVNRKDIVEMFMTLHGVGSVTANKFYDMGYRTFEDLWLEARLTKAQELSIYYRNQLSLRIPRKEMDDINQSFKNIFPDLIFEMVGSYRRKESSSGDIDILVMKDNDVSLFSIVNELKKYNSIIGDLGLGESKYLGIFHLPGLNARRLDILIISPENWATALMYFTGSYKFNILMRQRAIDLGLKLNEYGLYQHSEEKLELIPIKSEEDIFNILGVKYISPEERIKELNSLIFI